MKIELMYNDRNEKIGFKLIKEETDDTNVVESVRNMWFFGMNDTALEYNGRKSNKETDETIELKWAIKSHCDEEHARMEDEARELMLNLNKGSIDLRKNISLNDMPQEIREQFE